MSKLRRNLITALWMIALLGGARSAVAQVVVADINGDGINDRVEAATAGTEVLVHASHRRHSQRLRVRGADRIIRLVVSDVNRDGRADIIVTTRWSGLQIWLNAGRGRFRPARRMPPATPDWRRSGGANDDRQSPTTDDGADVLATVLVTSSARARAPTPDALFRPFRPTRVTARSRSIRPRIPRGPPHDPALS